MIKFLATSLSLWVVVTPVIAGVYLLTRHLLTTYWEAYLGAYAALDATEITLISAAAGYILFRLIISGVEAE